MRCHLMIGGAIAALMAVSVPMAGEPRAGAVPMTAADFAAVLANHGNAGTPVKADQAAQQMLRLGVPLGDPKAALTEERLAAVMSFYGVPATTSNPDALVDAELGRTAASILGSTLLSAVGTEKRKSLNPSVELDLCLSERNHGQCVNCCKTLGSQSSACANFCQNVQPSPSSPL